uniref:Uncharacterized protein n=1 Tax=Janibacter limosus TaxID=53458 RepID=A0AC61U581_9MICO|nr:hypothetical protein [Janibacter limosus]
MHGFADDNTSPAELAQIVLDYSKERLELDPVPLDRPLTPAQLQEEAGQTITAEGLGGHRAMDLFAEVLAPACLSVDHPRYLSFIPCAPTEAAAMFDLVVGASSIYAGSWLEGSGAVYAENRGAAVDRRPRRPPRVVGRGLRPGRHDRQPVGPRRGPHRGRGAPRPPASGPSAWRPPAARTRRSSRRATSWTPS